VSFGGQWLAASAPEKIENYFRIPARHLGARAPFTADSFKVSPEIWRERIAIPMAVALWTVDQSSERMGMC